MTEQARLTGKKPAPKWNQTEVSRCLLPVLHWVDPTKEDEDGPEELRYEEARAACLSRPEAYRQLWKVYTTVTEEVYDRWFGWIDCEEEILEAAFDFIGKILHDANKETPKLTFSIEKDTYFAGMFHITDGDRAVDLSAPFAGYYFCDERLFADYRTRRMELEEQCRALIGRYRLYYHRIRTWYRNEGERECPLSAEHHAYMQLYDYLADRMAYEEKLQDDRRALEYERGGLGWFHRGRKRQIGRELQELDIAQAKLELEDAQERYAALEEETERRRVAWERELKNLPLTAFGRRKELKRKLSESREDLEEERKNLKIDELSARYRRLKEKKQAKLK